MRCRFEDRLTTGDCGRLLGTGFDSFCSRQSPVGGRKRGTFPRARRSKGMRSGLLYLVVLGIAGCVAVGASKLQTQNSNPQNPDKVVKTDAEWKKLLSPEAYKVLRQAGTEAAYSGKYWDNHEKGDYFCAGFGQKLFSSDTKFESHTGWPSFWQPVSKRQLSNAPTTVSECTAPKFYAAVATATSDTFLTTAPNRPAFATA